ncbi:MAG: hypothetical protein K2O73_02000, partial [Lachnospiraceae bacterium]|nr:hypothetical protein [Lachnospiraceae bacterium]
QRMRERLLMDIHWEEAEAGGQKAAGKCSFDWEKWEKSIRSIYSKAAEGVIALQHRLDWYSVDYTDIYRAEWDRIKEILREPPSSRELEEYLASVGLELEQFEKLYGEKKITDALWYAKDLKDRYSVLWMYSDLIGMDGNGV